MRTQQPTNNSLVCGHRGVSADLTVNDLNIEGGLTISPGQSLTIGENKNNAVLYNTGTLAIGSGTLNVNGEFIQDKGHTFGEQLPDADKEALLRFIKKF